MRTRCPGCGTVFRVTSEQLRLKFGKVRCGNCQAVFNAFDQLLTEPLAVSPPNRHDPDDDLPALQPELELNPPEEAAPEPSSVLVPESTLTVAPFAVLPVKEPEPEVVISHLVEEAPTPLVGNADETTEASTSAARQAGLMAARELTDTPAYNRWAEGTLASSGLGGFAGDTTRRVVWPFVIVSVLLAGILLCQLAYVYRTELVLRWPGTASVYALLAVDVPLPRNPEMVLIETSDLQADNTRGLFVLQATLRNRASYAQAWPGLELTLTDTRDAVVSRRVLLAADYLPPAQDAAAFPGGAEVAVKLWIEAKDLGAAGYRLYLFYP